VEESTRLQGLRFEASSAASCILASLDAAFRKLTRIDWTTKPTSKQANASVKAICEKPALAQSVQIRPTRVTTHIANIVPTTIRRSVM
jgi:hypothetical protein